MRLLRVFCALTALAGLAAAQTATGTITGTLSDPAGAVVPSAPMTLVNSATGALYQTATSATGNFAFGQLPVGTYQLTVEVTGFKTYIRQNLGVQTAQTVRVDIVLEVGTAAESVTVTAAASMLETENAELAMNVTTSRLNSLPILGTGRGTASPAGVRNPLAASLLVPGVFFNPAQAMRVNGSPANTYGIKLDGQDITNGVNTSSSQQQVQPSVEALEEVAIQSSNYSAEFGQAGSGLFQFTTRSGGNQFHGSVYDYFVNEALNSSQPFSNIRNRARRNDFGGSIGGPVWIPGVYDGHDKTFFFFNLEMYKETSTISDQFRTVPIAAYRTGDFSSLLARPFTGALATDGLGNPMQEGMIFDPLTERLAPDGTRARLQFDGNMIPANRFDTSAIKYQNLVPEANGPGLINNFNNAFVSDRLTPIPSIKIDHNFGSSVKIGFYRSSTWTETPYATGFGGSEGFPDEITATRGTFIYSRTWRGNLDWTITPTMLMHFGVGYVVNDFSDRSPITDFDTEAVLGIRGATVSPENGQRIPVFGARLGAQSTGGMSNTGPFAQVRNLLQRPTAQLSLSWVNSNHTYKFGGEFRIDGYPDSTFTNTSGNFTWNQNQTINPFFQGKALGGLYAGFPYASFLLGRVNSFTIAQPTNTRGGRLFLSWFAQDTYKATRKLTVDYGLRWDLFTYPREHYGRSPAFSPNVANPIAGGHLGGTIFEQTCNCNFAQNYKHAYAPRVGVAYQIDPKTVLRIGLGMSYSMSQGGGQGAAGANQSAAATNFGDAAMILSQGIPLNPVWPDLDPGLFGTVTGANPPYVDQNYGRPSRMWQWNVGLQREIMSDLVVEASYVANRGVWWRSASLVDINALRPDILQNVYGLNWANSADRAILAAQLNSAAAGPFRNRIPYSGYPTNTTVAQSLRTYPQFGNLAVTGAPLGKTWYDSLQMKATKRFSRGLDFTWTYTYSKELHLGADNNLGGGVVNDVFNLDTNKQLSSFSRPHAMVLAANYTLPSWGLNSVLDYAVKDWTIGAVLQYTSGLPIETPDNNNNNNNVTLPRSASTYATRVPGEPLYLVDLNCNCYDPARTVVLNEAAWKNTPSGSFSPSAAYYNDFRFRRRPSELMSVGRIFRFGEGRTFLIRAEFTNIFNRTLMTIPGATVATGGFVDPSTLLGSALSPDDGSPYTSGFGTINTTGSVSGERNGTIVARIQF